MSPESPSPLLCIQGLSIQIGGRAILDNVSFTITSGEYTVVVGPNGAGKTTLLRCLVRILRGQGAIELEGQPLEGYRQRDLARRIAYVPQAGNWAAPFTVEQFVAMGRYPHLSPFSPLGRKDHRVVREALERTGTLPFADRMLDTLSGGERQRVGIAAALAQEARLLLLDEPTTFLDYRHQAEVLALLREANRETGVTILAVTHDLNHAALEANRAIALRDGKIAYCGTARDLMQSEVLQRVYGTELLLVEHPTASIPVVIPHAAQSTMPLGVGP
ncbi:MAG: ABC transporter ATP-binding protein [Patescibacteria group bacterium]|nr:ABC transporter ATP-binding protein [Patescibacteria group bacterium]